MIAAKPFVVGMDAQDQLGATDCDAGLVAQFMDQRVANAFPSFDTATGQVPAADIGVTDQRNVAVGPDNNAANAQRHAARLPPERLHEWPHNRLDALSPVHAATPASQYRVGGLCTGPIHAVLGKFLMYALIAIGLVAGIFGLLNLIEYRRLD